MAHPESEARLRQQREIVILHAADRIHEVQAACNGEPRIVIVVEPPGHVVPVQPVLLNAQDGGLVRIVAQAQGVEQNLIEPAPVAFLGIDGEAAA